MPLQIGGFHKIAFDDAQSANSGAHEQVGRRRADCPASDENGAGGKEPLLAFFADTGEKHLPRIFFPKRFVHVPTGLAMCVFFLY